MAFELFCATLSRRNLKQRNFQRLINVFNILFFFLVIATSLCPFPGRAFLSKIESLCKSGTPLPPGKSRSPRHSHITKNSTPNAAPLKLRSRRHYNSKKKSLETCSTLTYSCLNSLIVTRGVTMAFLFLANRFPQALLIAAHSFCRPKSLHCFLVTSSWKHSLIALSLRDPLPWSYFRKNSNSFANMKPPPNGLYAPAFNGVT